MKAFLRLKLNLFVQSGKISQTFLSSIGGITGLFIFINLYKQRKMSDISYMTREGYDKLSSELEELKTKGREEAAKAIAEARDKGDLSENAEYDAAKNAQGMLELKINEMELSLASARVIDKSQLDTSKVTVLSRVTMKNLKINKEVTYTLVSEAEANLKERKISVDSPIGKGLLGKEKGEIANIVTPAGQIQFEIIDINM